jgi:carboxylesterase type B
MPDRWSGVRITRQYKYRAIQTRNPWDLIDVGRTDEDCLYLNIVAPANSDEQFPHGYPTMIYLHGGGYQMDSAQKYHYKNLARLFCKHGVIVVTVGYRLGSAWKDAKKLLK